MRQLRKLRTIKRPTAALSVYAPPGRKFVRVERSMKTHPPPTPQPTPCRLWQGALDASGYGAIKRYVDGERKSYKVHRWVMEVALQRFLDPSEVILHLCDNRACYRFDHLRLGTVAENNQDMRDKGRGVAPPVNRMLGAANPNSREARAARQRDARA